MASGDFDVYRGDMARPTLECRGMGDDTNMMSALAIVRKML